MSHLASANAHAVYYSYSSMDLSVDVIRPLVSSIRDYDPHFKENYQTLSNQLAAVVSKDTSAMQLFTAVLSSIRDKIVDIKNTAFITRNELANIRDQLALSIRNTQTKLDALSAEKESLIGQKQVLERQIQAKKDEINGYMTAFWIFSWIIALILESIKPFDAALNEIKSKLAAKQQEIANLDNQTKSMQQSLNQSIDLFNSNQQLSTQCDTMQNNITNIQSSLKRLDVESHFLKAKLMTLEKDWSGLMVIVNQYA
jgi:chromosome segregation ATPase